VRIVLILAACFSLAAMAPMAAASAKKTSTTTSSDRRAVFMKDARALCKQKHGPTATVYRLEIKSDNRHYVVYCGTNW